MHLSDEPKILRSEKFDFRSKKTTIEAQGGKA